jgi:hypothetical protein
VRGWVYSIFSSLSFITPTPSVFLTLDVSVVVPQCDLGVGGLGGVGQGTREEVHSVIVVWCTQLLNLVFVFFHKRWTCCWTLRHKDTCINTTRVTVKFFSGYWLIWLLNFWVSLSIPLIIRQRTQIQYQWFDYQVIWHYLLCTLSPTNCTPVSYPP